MWPSSSSKKLSKNTPGVGNEYEVFVPALFALNLNRNPEVEFFTIRSNVIGFGNLDDLVIDVTTKTEELHFAFQLKHKERKDYLFAGNFTAKGQFSLEQFCRGFTSFKEKNKKYHVILYTNAKFDPKNVEKVTSFRLTESDFCPGRGLFNTNCNSGNVYKFDVNDNTENGEKVTVEDFGNFFSHFSFYAGQKNVNEFEQSVFDILKSEEVALKYINLFRKWHRGFFTNKTIDKKTVNLHLADFFFSPFIIKEHCLWNRDNENIRLFETAIRKFDITIINASKEDITCPQPSLDIFEGMHGPSILKLAKDMKIVGKFDKDLKPNSKRKVFFYYFEEPIFIGFDDKSRTFVNMAVKMCHLKENKIKLVLLGERTDSDKFHSLAVFETLNDLHQLDEQHYQSITRNCQLSIQGRKTILLETLINWYKEIEEMVGSKEILQMLRDDYRIGEKREDLPKSYVPRRISTMLFDADTLLNHIRTRKDLLIIDCDNKFHLIQGVIEEKNIEFVEMKDYLLYPSSENIIITSMEECAKPLFDLICEGNNHRNVHFVKIFDQNNFLLVLTTKKKFKKVKSEKLYLEEDRIHTLLNGAINVLCANPGKGKSVMFKYLKNTCESEFWTVAVDLKTYNNFFKKKPSTDQLLCSLKLIEKGRNKTFTGGIKNVYLKRKKIIFFFDGLDELEFDCVDHVLKLVNELSSLGYRIWISSRQNLQKKIESELNLFSVDIVELSDEQQENYITHRLHNRYEEVQIKEIITKILNSTDIANNRILLGIPLQLFLLTQIFLDDERQYKMLGERIFILTKIYRIFFEGKYKFLAIKRRHENKQFDLSTLDDQLEKYEIVGLQTCFTKDVFNQLDVDVRKTQKFLEIVKLRGDPLGIVTKINDDNKAVFEHYTYAEYFACVFLSKNFEKVRLLRDQLFSEQYQNLKIILNIILAEEYPLHLAVIHKNLDEVKKYLHHEGVYDQGGRNPLHLATINCKKYQSINHCKTKFINDCHLDSFEGEESINKEILQVLSKFNPLENDSLFLWSSLDYCKAAESLFPIEKFLERDNRSTEISLFLQQHYDDVTIAYYSSRFAYPNLLSSLLNRKKNFFGRIFDFFLNKKSKIVNIKTGKSDSLLHLAVKPSCRSHIINNQEETDDEIEVVKLLLGAGIQVNAINEYGMTALDWAISRKHMKTAALLQAKGGKVNAAIEKLGEAALYEAIKEENIELIDLLVRNKVDVNASESEKGKTAIDIAINHGKTKMLYHLLKKGASINITAEKGHLLLQAASRKGAVKLVNLLLHKNINVDAADEDGNTALHIAASKGKSTVLKLLIRSGADVNVRNNKGNTPLHEACSIELFALAHALFLNNKEHLKDKLLNLHTSSAMKTLFYEAAKRSHIAIIKTLLNKNVDVYAKNHLGLTPLDLIQRHGHLYSIELIDRRSELLASIWNN